VLPRSTRYNGLAVANVHDRKIAAVEISALRVWLTLTFTLQWGIYSPDTPGTHSSSGIELIVLPTLTVPRERHTSASVG
jgi:hypothetical protein